MEQKSKEPLNKVTECWLSINAIDTIWTPFPTDDLILLHQSQVDSKNGLDPLDPGMPSGASWGELEKGCPQVPH